MVAMLKTVDNNQHQSTQEQKLAAALAELPAKIPDPTKSAVLLNKNARKVTDSLARRIEQIVGSDCCYYSHTIEQAEEFAKEIVNEGYGTIVCGGGDGTMARAINMVMSYIKETNNWRAERFLRTGEKQERLVPPRFGFLRLGTGNGISKVVGAKDPLDDLRHVIDYAPGHTVEIPLIEHNGQRFFFGGLGYDSMVLNDYDQLKERAKGPLMSRLLQGLGGYFAAIFTRSIPRILFRRTSSVQARIISRGKGYYIDPRRGDAVSEIPPGTTVFEGSATLIAAGSSPFFGYGIKVFPFANIVPKMMHLRVATMGPFTMLANILGIWNGSYRNPAKLFDFIVDDVKIELVHPYPFQHSGDAQGMVDDVVLSICDEPLKLVDYYPPIQFSSSRKQKKIFEPIRRHTLS